jgi:hypothetical protein
MVAIEGKPRHTELKCQGGLIDQERVLTVRDDMIVVIKSNQFSKSSWDMILLWSSV